VAEEIVVQHYSEEYRDDIINLILDIQQNEYQIPIQKEDQPDLSDIPGFYQKRIGNFWIALYHNQLVGTISLLDIWIGKPLILSPAFPPIHTVHATFIAHGVPSATLFLSNISLHFFGKSYGFLSYLCKISFCAQFVNFAQHGFVWLD